jgi:hypothetical protein
MNRFSLEALGLAGACLTILGAVRAQGAAAIPCPAATPAVVSYTCVPTGSLFSSIVGLAGTVLVPFTTADDEVLALPFPPGFTFASYGVAQTTISISINGNAHFGTFGSPDYVNRHVGDNAIPNGGIFPWFDDLHLGGATGASGPGFVYARFDLAPGAESLTIEWNTVRNYPATSTSTFTFQTVLFASTHGTLPNVIDFRYNRASQPGLTVCQGAPSATVGLEPNLTAPSVPLGAIDCSGREAANETFPRCDLRMTPRQRAEANASVSMTVVAQPAFCSIIGMTGTQAAGTACAGTTCYDDENTSDMAGTAIQLPWKVNFAGRHFKSVNMNSNGLLGLGQGETFFNFTNGTLPAGGTEPDLVLAPFWDDLESTLPGAGMFWRLDGSPGCRVATFEWSNMGRWITPGGDCQAISGSLVSFQVRIYEGSAGTLFMLTGQCPYDFVLPGVGNDRIEFWYDHVNFQPSAYTATIGWEDATGAAGGVLPGSPTLSALPLNATGAPGMVVLATCDTGQVRYYGDPSNSGAPGLLLPEIRTNCVAPIVGNPFGLTLHGSSPSSIALMLVDLGPPLPGTKTPVPCGGIPTPFGIANVNIFSAALFNFFVGFTGPGVGCATFPLTIPANPALIGLTLYAQWGVLAGTGTEVTEGVKVVIGG